MSSALKKLAAKVREDTKRSGFLSEAHLAALLTVIDAMPEEAPCGGSRCYRANDGTWAHSSKSYGTCAVRNAASEEPSQLATPRRAHDGPLTGRNLVLIDAESIDALKAKRDVAETAARELWVALYGVVGWDIQARTVEGQALARHAAYGDKKK